MKKRKPKEGKILQVGDWVWTSKSTTSSILPGKRYRVVAIYDRNYFSIDIPGRTEPWLCQSELQDLNLPWNVKWEVDNFNKNLEKILKDD